MPVVAVNAAIKQLHRPGSGLLRDNVESAREPTGVEDKVSPSEIRLF